MRRSAFVALLFASCASAPPREPVRIAIIEVVSKVSPRGPDYASWAKDYLHDALFASGRFRLLERGHVDAVLEQTGRNPNKAGLVMGAEWIIYGAVTEAVYRGESGPANRRPTFAEVELQLRVVRVQTGEILYSKHLRGTSMSSVDAHHESLLRQATKLAVEQAVADIAKLNP